MVITYEKPGRGELPVQDLWPIPDIVLVEQLPEKSGMFLMTEKPMQEITAGHIQNYFITVDHHKDYYKLQYTGLS